MALIPRKRMSSDLLDPEPREGSYNGVTSDGVFKGTGKAIDNILDDGSASEAIVVAVPSSQSGDYVVGNYYEVQGKVAQLRTKTEGDNVTQLTFDTTSGVLEAMNNIIEDISSIGSPLQWKGSATVAQLNAGITGIQPGWTYTLTDAGTLTDGSIAVEAGDEVAWTEDGEWFKVGGDSSKVEVLQVNWDTDHFVFPTFNDVNSLVVTKKKSVCLVQNNSGGSKVVRWLCGRSSGGANQFYKFLSEKGEVLYIYQDGTTKIEYISALSKSIAPDYSQLTFPIAEGTACMRHGERYVANTTIATAEEWDYSHWTETSVEDVISNVKKELPKQSILEYADDWEDISNEFVLLSGVKVYLEASEIGSLSDLHILFSKKLSVIYFNNSNCRLISSSTLPSDGSWRHLLRYGGNKFKTTSTGGSNPQLNTFTSPIDVMRGYILILLFRADGSTTEMGDIAWTGSSDPNIDSISTRRIITMNQNATGVWCKQLLFTVDTST